MATENERAAFYEAHKDDPDVWEPTEGAATPRGRGEMTATITVRFSAEEAETIRRRAKESGSTYSEVIRDAVRRCGNSEAWIELPAGGTSLIANLGELSLGENDFVFEQEWPVPRTRTATPATI
ncbi:MAG: ribbon-helix-helix protein, CopG family [Chloroflexi bacterium]|nr:ribbon-helix-helix protein, CopG family [Chloroflexota bacterium]